MDRMGKQAPRAWWLWGRVARVVVVHVNQPRVLETLWVTSIKQEALVLRSNDGAHDRHTHMLIRCLLTMLV